MRRFYYWTRWVFLIPLVAAAYLAIQVAGLLIAVPYMRDWFGPDDTPTTHDVSWDWFVQPFVCLCIGTSAAFAVLKLARIVAPSSKVVAIRVVAALLFLWALSNFVFAAIHILSVDLSQTLIALAANLAAGFVGLRYALFLKSEMEIVDDAP
jgi:hypothetical protein